MVAVEVLENKFFHLHNDRISYLFYVMENGQLGHLYYGAFLGELTKEDFRYMLLRESKSAGTRRSRAGISGLRIIRFPRRRNRSHGR